jgi:hypothetical protein
MPYDKEFRNSAQTIPKASRPDAQRRCGEAATQPTRERELRLCPCRAEVSGI